MLGYWVVSFKLTKYHQYTVTLVALAGIQHCQGDRRLKHRVHDLGLLPCDVLEHSMCYHGIAITSDRLRQAVGIGSVLYHCHVTDLRISTAIEYYVPSIHIINNFVQCLHERKNLHTLTISIAIIKDMKILTQ